jgi:hypothetical protein
MPSKTVQRNIELVRHNENTKEMRTKKKTAAGKLKKTKKDPAALNDLGYCQEKKKTT